MVKDFIINRIKLWFSRFKTITEIGHYAAIGAGQGVGPGIMVTCLTKRCLIQLEMRGYSGQIYNSIDEHMVRLGQIEQIIIKFLIPF